MRIFPALVFGLLLAGCQPDAATQAVSIDELVPRQPAPQAAILTFDKVEVPVELNVVREREALALEWVAFGEAIEVERYVQTADSLALSEALKETYEPPLVLLGKGSGQPWEGVLSSAGVSRKASASLALSSESIDVLGQRVAARKVQAEMLIGDVPELAVERTLTFWFVPGQGIVQRQFGQWSSRKPRKEETLQ